MRRQPAANRSQYAESILKPLVARREAAVRRHAGRGALIRQRRPLWMALVFTRGADEAHIIVVIAHGDCYAAAPFKGRAPASKHQRDRRQQRQPADITLHISPHCIMRLHEDMIELFMASWRREARARNRTPALATMMIASLLPASSLLCKSSMAGVRQIVTSCRHHIAASISAGAKLNQAAPGRDEISEIMLTKASSPAASRTMSAKMRRHGGYDSAHAYLCHHNRNAMARRPSVMAGRGEPWRHWFPSPITANTSR